MSKEIFEKLLERSILFFLSGIILLLLGATGGITIGGVALQLSEIIWRIIISAVGSLFITLGIILILREERKNTSNESKTNNFKGMSNKHNKEDSSTINILNKWDVESFLARLATAKKICMLSVSNYSLIHTHFQEFESFMQKGGELQCIYMKPQEELLKLVALRSVGIESDPNHLLSQYSQTIAALQDFAQAAPKRRQVQAKEIGYMHGIVLTLIDDHLPTGVAYVTLNGFGHHYTSRPCLIIQQEKAGELFTFCKEIFENTWSSPESKVIEL